PADLVVAAPSLGQAPHDDVPVGDDADHRVAVDDDEVSDALGFHQLGRFPHTLVRPDRPRVGGHRICNGCSHGFILSAPVETTMALRKATFKRFCESLAANGAAPASAQYSYGQRSVQVRVWWRPLGAEKITTNRRVRPTSDVL